MEDSTLLMMDHGTKTIIPVNEGIYHISQFNSEKKLNEKYSGNFVLEPSGKLKQIKSVSIQGVLGTTFWSRVFNFLNATKSIEVKLEVCEQELSDFMPIIIQYLNLESSVDRL